MSKRDAVPDDVESDESPADDEAELIEKVQSMRLGVRSRGFYTDLMNRIESSYLARHSGRKLRWAYAPEERRDFSQITKWRAYGYTPVSYTEAGIEPFAGKSSESVRIGDTILMSIDADSHKALKAAIDRDAKDELKRVKREYYASVAALRVGKHKGRPIGDAVIGIEEHGVTLPE